MTQTSSLRLSLFLLRITVFLVIFMWTIDKFINPEHAAGIFQKFYSVGGLGSEIMYAIGAIEIVILLMFLGGIKKTLTYGIVALLHAGSTLSAFEKYLAPFDGANLLFFAAWPMLAACIALFLLRAQDTLLTVGR